GSTRGDSVCPIPNDAVAVIGMEAGRPTRFSVLVPCLPSVSLPVGLLLNELARGICPPDDRGRCEQQCIEALAVQGVPLSRCSRHMACHEYPLRRPLPVARCNATSIVGRQGNRYSPDVRMRDNPQNRIGAPPRLGSRVQHPSAECQVSTRLTPS